MQKNNGILFDIISAACIIEKVCIDRIYDDMQSAYLGERIVTYYEK